MLAARTLTERPRCLVLLYPQRPVARMPALLGTDQMFTIIGDPGKPEADASAG